MKKQTFKLTKNFPIVEGDATVSIDGYHTHVFTGDSIDLTVEVNILYSRWLGIKHVFLTPVTGIDSVEEVKSSLRNASIE